MTTVATSTEWGIFFALIFALMGLDLGILHRRAEEMSFRAAAIWTTFWVSLAAAFCGWVYLRFGQEADLLFATGYLVEEALSIDNVFVFSLIFSYFAVPKFTQRRVLFWGIFGALVLRGIFIGGGAALVNAFDWTLILFGALLVYTGIRLFFHDEENVDPTKNFLVRIAKAILPFHDSYQREHFFVRIDGRWLATPLFVVLLAIEGSDVLFAVDSIPAIFGITSDPFLIYTSNIFAILGLRSLYFLISNMMDRFEHLQYGLSIILIFIGLKMLLANYWHPPIAVSLGFIAVVLLVSVVASVMLTNGDSE